MTRDAFVSAALELRGLTEPAPDLGALVDPGGDPAHQGQIERLSLCMLVYRGLLCRVLDVPTDLSRAYQPYRPGTIPAILGAILDAAGAKRTPTIDSPPQAGDGLWYEAAAGYPEHVDACVVEIAPYEEWMGAGAPWGHDLSAIAGGQRDEAGHETVKLLARELRWRDGAWVCQATKRRVRWVLDADLLAQRYPPTV